MSHPPRSMASKLDILLSMRGRTWRLEKMSDMMWTVGMYRLVSHDTTHLTDLIGGNVRFRLCIHTIFCVWCT